MNEKSMCSVEGCENRAHLRGWCIKHYARWRRHGDPLGYATPVRLSALERFWAKVDKDGPLKPWMISRCWVWTASATTPRLGDDSYGIFRPKNPGPRVRAHRFSYEALIGPIPKGLTVDHLCRTTLCVNPFHLEAVTNRVNVLRGFGASARNARKTHCPYGHQYSEENTYYPPNRHHRQCRICIKRRSDEAHARRRLRKLEEYPHE